MRGNMKQPKGKVQAPAPAKPGVKGVPGSVRAAAQQQQQPPPQQPQQEEQRQPSQQQQRGGS